MDEIAVPFYVAAARLKAVLRHHFSSNLTWCIQVPRMILPIDSVAPEANKWRAFASRDLRLLNALLIENAIAFREVRQSLRDCAILFRDRTISGPAVEVFGELLSTIMEAPWLSGCKLKSPEASEDESVWVEFHLIEPNAHLAEEMVAAMRTLRCRPEVRSLILRPESSELGTREDDPVSLYEIALRTFKEEGKTKPARAARKLVEERTGKKYGPDSLRVMLTRRRKKAKGKPTS
jgi:hypothetical protein